jgi:hypothetical protein
MGLSWQIQVWGYWKFKDGDWHLFDEESGGISSVTHTQKML